MIRVRFSCLNRAYKRKCQGMRSGRNKGVGMYSPSWTSWWSEGHGRLLKGVLGRQRVPVLVSGGSCKCGVPVCQACKCCVFAASTMLDWLASRGPMGQVKRDPGRGIRWTEGLCLCSGDPQMCVSLWTYWVSCACCQYQATALVSHTHSCCLRKHLVCAVSVASLVTVLCVSVCLYLWDMHLSSLLVEPVNSSSWDWSPGCLRPWVFKLPGWSPVHGQEATLGVELLEAAATYSMT